MPSSSPTEGDTVAVRELSAGEAASAVPALTDILWDCVAQGASVGFMADTPRAEMVQFWEGVVADVRAGGTRLLVAEVDGRILGTVSLILIGRPNQPHRAELAKMLVHSAARRRGIGARLVAEAEALAGRLGRTLLCLDTCEHTEAHRMYRRLGFVDLGAIPGFALYPDGRICNSAFMYKSLA